MFFKIKCFHFSRSRFQLRNFICFSFCYWLGILVYRINLLYNLWKILLDFLTRQEEEGITHNHTHNQYLTSTGYFVDSSRERHPYRPTMMKAWFYLTIFLSTFDNLANFGRNLNIPRCCIETNIISSLWLLFSVENTMHRFFYNA